MPYALKIDIKELSKNSVLRPRVFRRAFKAALRNSIAYWHRVYLPLHFTKAAFYRYPQYRALSTRKKAPLVDSGALRDRLTSRKQLTNISGTANSMALRLKYGRPPRFREDRIKEEAAIEAAKKKIPYDVALSRVYSRAGYSPTAKKYFRDLIPITNRQEEEKFQDVLMDGIVHFDGQYMKNTGSGAFSLKQDGTVVRHRSARRKKSLTRRWGDR